MPNMVKFNGGVGGDDEVKVKKKMKRNRSLIIIL